VKLMRMVTGDADHPPPLIVKLLLMALVSPLDAAVSV
jgi:hypothetical protein